MVESARAGLRPLRLPLEALLGLPRAGAWTLVAAWCALITLLSSQPGSAEPSAWIWSVLSNGAHAPEFGLLAAWLSLLAPRREGWPDLRARVRLAVVATVAGLGLSDELHQGLTPGRDLSIFDLLTDVVGAALMLELIAYLARREAKLSGFAARFALAACAAFACGALATFVPRCFPDIAWF